MDAFRIDLPRVDAFVRRLQAIIHFDPDAAFA
jgi:hypothetical protein